MVIVYCKWDDAPIREFLDRSARLILILDKSDVTWEEIPRDLLEQMERVYRVDSTDSIDQMNAIAVDLEMSGVSVDRVIASHEQAQYGAALIAHRLGLEEGAIGTTTGARDKRLMKARVRTSGVSTARFATISDVSDLERIEEIAKEIGFPAVVKPVSGVASIATTRVHNLTQLREVVGGHAEDYTIPWSRQLIVEESIAGDEYHVDAVWRDGEPWVFSINKYFGPRLTLNEGEPLNGAYALAESDYPEFYARTRQLHDKVNTALGIRRGITHLEMFHDPASQELYFSEIATRPGGSCVPEAAGAKYGPDLYEIWAEETVDGAREKLRWQAAEFSYTGWLNISPKSSGIISHIPSFDDLLAHPNILGVKCTRTVGSRITLAHPSVWCLMLIIGANTEDDIVRLAQDLNDKITVEVTPFPA
ncbi:ATP-grasp domain-containing protein [Kitasatospora griseola]|uniref:ATP-grasp domain-containing protein n=1 Tax=Kitasatospora griseola TaxID=2064 RepID=UPI00343B563E